MEYDVAADGSGPVLINLDWVQWVAIEKKE